LKKVKIELRTKLFHQEAKDFLDKCMRNHPIGTEFYIDVVQTGYHPFTNLEIEDQVRACYGSLNRDLSFASINKPNESFRSALLNLTKESEELIQRFFIENDDLSNNEVPSEVYHYLQTYKGRAKQLSEYLIKEASQIF